jgi:hypothetical protein
LKHHGKSFGANEVTIEVVDCKIRTRQNLSSQVVEVRDWEGVRVLRIVVQGAQGIADTKLQSNIVLSLSPNLPICTTRMARIHG